LIEREILTPANRLSQHMLESWQNGDFWVCYAAGRSWAFDKLYWAKIDRRFFGDDDLEGRLKLLTFEERDALDGFVQSLEAYVKGRTDSCGLDILGLFERRAVESS
jgi:hypothetical protein